MLGSLGWAHHMVSVDVDCDPGPKKSVTLRCGRPSPADSGDPLEHSHGLGLCVDIDVVVEYLTSFLQETTPVQVSISRTFVLGMPRADFGPIGVYCGFWLHETRNLMNDNHVAREYVTEFECTFDNLKTIISDGTDEECAELYESFSGFFDRLAEALGPVRAWLDCDYDVQENSTGAHFMDIVPIGCSQFHSATEGISALRNSAHQIDSVGDWGLVVKAAHTFLLPVDRLFQEIVLPRMTSVGSILGFAGIPARTHLQQCAARLASH